jgi:FkbM family methyltransferase
VGGEGARLIAQPGMADLKDPTPGPTMPAAPARLEDLLADAAPGVVGISYGLRQCRHGPMLFNRRDIYVGRSLATYGEYSEAEIIVLRQLLRPGAIIVEAGANIGAHTVPLARLAGEGGCVHAFEPQRLQFQILCANLALNGLYNVFAQQQALGSAPGSLQVPLLSPAMAQNFGGLSLEGQGSGERVAVTTVDALGLERLNLIKADVEGMERAVLEGARATITRLRPVIYVECDRRDRAPALIELILSFGYRAWWHIPSFFNPENYAGNRENVFARMASGNLLALPAERAGQIELPPVAGPDDWPAHVRIPDATPAPPGR